MFNRLTTKQLQTILRLGLIRLGFGVWVVMTSLFLDIPNLFLKSLVISLPILIFIGYQKRADLLLGKKKVFEELAKNYLVILLIQLVLDLFDSVAWTGLVIFVLFMIWRVYNNKEDVKKYWDDYVKQMKTK